MKNKTTLSLYWKCQLIGWSVAALYWGYVGFTGTRFNLWLGILQFVLDVFVYILLTHLYRNFSLSNHWQNLNLGDLLKRIIPAVIVLGVAYTLITMVKVYLFQVWASPEQPVSFTKFFEFYWASIFMAGIRLMSIWLLAYHMYHYAQREISITKENARLSIIAKDAQLNNLSAQLNPHFLFNSLNNIKALVIENPDSARRAIDLLSDLLRTSLYRNDMLIPIKDELALVNDYLELEKMRFEERLQVSIETNNELSTALILPLSIQALVENAIKHGIAKQSNGGLIAIKIEQANGFIKTTVSNPGQLDTEKQTAGLGLKNLDERLKLQFNGNARLDLEQQGEIVLATLLIPIA
ncbi:MAG TPA: histidine kinase [Mucilaginibacter sp.]|nr:histidine kinase [Mucilaginibacter sp.]